MFDPQWTEILGSDALVAAGMSADIDRLGREISEIINQKNEAHASKHGADLFRATNKTVGALTSIRTSVTTFEQYGTLIENLYFVFHEGPGQRLLTVPQSFSDVNLLRTGLQHDVDHGKVAVSLPSGEKLAKHLLDTLLERRPPPLFPLSGS